MTSADIRRHAESMSDHDRSIETYVEVRNIKERMDRGHIPEQCEGHKISFRWMWVCITTALCGLGWLFKAVYHIGLG